jgi:hypothetical protein
MARLYRNTNLSFSVRVLVSCASLVNLAGAKLMLPMLYGRVHILASLWFRRKAASTEISPTAYLSPA